MTDEAKVPQNVVEEFQEKIQKAREEINKIIVGQNVVVERILLAIFCRGHAIMEGVPGTGKTMLVNTLSKVLGLQFNRIQFTPDLLPSDIVGTDIIQEHPETGQRQLTFMKGPVFTNMLLADEINRTPPKTQAALLEAMQERKVTYGGKAMKLPSPFFTLATQNPIEQEGTYNLPEAQLDRFLVFLRVGYPDIDAEQVIVERFTTKYRAELEVVLTGEEILKFQDLVEQVLVREDIIQYILRIVRATRVSESYCLPYCKEYVSWGAGPRASLAITLCAKARALTQGRSFINTEDVREVCEPVLAHRLVLSYAAISEGITTSTVIDKILDSVETPDKA